MSEPLTLAIVAELVDELRVAFPRQAGKPETFAKVYLGHLGDLDAQAVQSAVQHVIRTDRTFPRVSRIRAVAREWVRRNRIEFSPAVGGHQERDEPCPVCGVHPTDTPGGNRTELLHDANKHHVYHREAAA